jgi:Zn-dependent peptidase ImmA (M78 family)
MSKTLNDSPFARAQQVLAELGIKSPPTPLEKIARAQGAVIRYAPLDDALSGMVYIKDTVPIIGVNSLHHPNRQRFTIAHELGHLVLHRAMLSNEVHVDKEFSAFDGTRLNRDAKSAAGTEDIEIQANQFAAELLMPRAFIDQALAGKQIDIEDDGPIEELAKKFRVSKQALEYKIRSRE